MLDPSDFYVQSKQDNKFPARTWGETCPKFIKFKLLAVNEIVEDQYRQYWVKYLGVTNTFLTEKVKCELPLCCCTSHTAGGECWCSLQEHYESIKWYCIKCRAPRYPSINEKYLSVWTPGHLIECNTFLCLGFIF